MLSKPHRNDLCNGARDSFLLACPQVDEFLRRRQQRFKSARTFDSAAAHHELRTDEWHVVALDVERVASSFFEDIKAFPTGTVEFDNALLMRDIHHEWHAKDSLYCTGIPEAKDTEGSRTSGSGNT